MPRTVQTVSGEPTFASFVPDLPRRVLVLAHGYPWPDNSCTDGELLAHASARVEAWKDFARSQGVILITPVFGGTAFPGYRKMGGEHPRPDDFVSHLVENIGRRHLGESFDGRFSLHGHSAGGQLAARYLLSHPERLRDVVLSAPSTFAFPDPRVTWPNGMAPGQGSVSDHETVPPAKPSWIAATTMVSVTVLVGSLDVEDRPPAPGQIGASRLARARHWVEQMRALAETEGLVANVRLVVVAGIDHDEDAMTAPAQACLVDVWVRSGPRTSASTELRDSSLGP